MDIRSINTRFLTFSPFWILFAANIFQGLGSFLPSLYLPSTQQCLLLVYIVNFHDIFSLRFRFEPRNNIRNSCAFFPQRSVQISPKIRKLILPIHILYIGASVPGLIFLGWLSDALDVQWSILISSLGSASAVFFLWGFSESLSPLLVFSCVYGFLAPSWSALWPRFVATSDGDDPRQASSLMGIFIAGVSRNFH